VSQSTTAPRAIEDGVPGGRIVWWTARWSLAAAGLWLALTGPALWRELYRPGAWSGPNDMDHHLGFAENFDSLLHPPNPHFLFHGGAKVFSWVPGLDIRSGGLVAMLLAVAATGPVLLALFRTPVDRRHGPLPAHTAFGLVVVVLLVESLGAYAGTDALLFVPDYLPVHTLFSPTATMLLPFMVAGVLLLVPFVDPSAPAPSRGHAVATGAVVLLGTIAKPAFVIAVVPAAGLLLLAQRGRPEPGAWAWRRKLVLFATWTGGLGAAGLAWQWYIVNWDVPRELRGGIIIDPLSVARDFGFLAPRFWLVALVPAVLLVLRPRWLASDVAARLLVAGSAVALAEFLLLREGGVRGDTAPNFLWPPQVALALLLFVAIRWLAVISVDPVGAGVAGRSRLGYLVAVQLVVASVIAGAAVTACSLGVTAVC